MSLSQLLPHYLWCPFRSTQQQQAVSLLLSPCYMLCRWVSLYSLKSLLVCWQQVATGGRWHTVEERGHRWEQEEACSLQQQLTKRNPSAEWSGGEWTFVDMYFMILDCVRYEKYVSRWSNIVGMYARIFQTEVIEILIRLFKSLNVPQLKCKSALQRQFLVM